MKQEERQRMTSVGGDGFDINELSALLCELDAVATQVGNIHSVWYIKDDLFL